MSEENKTIVLRWFEEVWSRGNFQVIEALLDPHCVGHGLEKKNGDEIEGIEEHQQFIGQFRGAFPDFGIGTDDLIAEGERVSVRLTVRGTHMAKGLGLEPTFVGILISGLALFWIRDGKIHNARYAFDFLNLYEQLGLLAMKPEFANREF
jgi:predicted ester cyclase